ncbi:MAG: phosphatase PAP2 family protein [Bacteroidales bacterium]|jgi:undecaprenyl-diphosphatase|nr:phosphatase PAP2 family protein [Bacteroidales bacterium]
MLNSTLYDIDISILRLVHHHRIVALDQVLYIISYATSFISIGLILGILFISVKSRSKPLRIIFFKMLAVLIIAATVSFSIKTLTSRERPFKTYPDIEKLSEAGSSSFPSGHTLEAFAIAVSLSLLIPKRKIIFPVFIWACLVAYSRMALGVHYPTDVLGGMIIGSLLGWLVPLLTGKFLLK